MSTGRAYQKDDTVYRAKVVRKDGSVFYIGPYASLGPARGQRTQWLKVSYVFSVTVERSAQSWELVPDE